MKIRRALLWPVGLLFGTRRPTVAVIRLTGVIGSGGRFRRGLSLAGFAGVIDRAFSLRGVKAVALVVNSPGGSPVQSSLLFKRIRALAAEKEIPVLAFAEDVAASGGYWLACAGDEIIADDSSIIGSIGVVSAGFGFPAMLERFGVERRVYKSGERKAMLDPFAPENVEDIERLAAVQRDVHAAFIDTVQGRRKGRLKAPEDKLFSGAFWSARQALDLGLVDSIGDLRSVLRDRFGKNVRMRTIEAPRSWLLRRPGLSGRVEPPAAWPMALMDEALAAVEERILRSRFGL